MSQFVSMQITKIYLVELLYSDGSQMAIFNTQFKRYMLV